MPNWREKILKSKRVQDGVDKRAEKVKAYWQSVAPVFDPTARKEHRQVPRRGAIGAYRDSIIIEPLPDADIPGRRIRDTDWKAKHIEYGRPPHFPKQAPLAKVKAKFR